MHCIVEICYYKHIIQYIFYQNMQTLSHTGIKSCDIKIKVLSVTNHIKVNNVK